MFDRMANDTRTAVMFEGDFCTLRDVIDYISESKKQVWVNLTDDELADDCLYKEDFSFARLIESKLREKNTVRITCVN
jgi:hypothetical protein